MLSKRIKHLNKNLTTKFIWNLLKIYHEIFYKDHTHKLYLKEFDVYLLNVWLNFICTTWKLSV